LHGFLGATFLASWILSIPLTIWLIVRGFRVSRKALSVGAAFCGASLIIAFAGTAQGGRVLHGLVSGLRCFNRFSPFVVLFASCGIAALWTTVSRRLVAAFVLILGLVFMLEFRDHPILNANLVQSVEPEVRLAEELRILCRNGVVALDPVVSDFMFGPYRLYFVAQRAGCVLDGISGVRVLPTTRLPAPISGLVKWGPESNGFEEIALVPIAEPVR
jgi:hypothetical protein